MRSDKSIVGATINEEHYFESTAASATSAGVHRPGSARVYFGLRSAVSASLYEGRLMYASDTGTLHYLGTSSHSTVKGDPLLLGVQSSMSTLQAITTATDTAVAFGTDEVYGGVSVHSTTNNPSRFIADRAGKWEFVVQAGYGDTVLSDKKGKIRWSGNTIVDEKWNSSSPVGPMCSSIVSMASGEYLEYLTWQNSGGATNSVVTTAGRSWARFIYRGV